MNIRYSVYIFIVYLFTQPTLASGKMEFWSSQKKGANFFNYLESQERFLEAKKIGVNFVRLAPNKWLNGRDKEKRGDFLIGKVSNYLGIIEKDFKRLLEVLDYAKKANIKVVLTMLSLPKRRWTQHNNGNGQEREIWKSFKAQEEAISFWRELAKRLRDHPSIVGYNILNEPAAEKLTPKFKGLFKSGSYYTYTKQYEGTPRDLNLFYSKVIKSIRSVDKDTPIIIDSGHWANAHTFSGLKKQKDGKVLYSFHLYDPYPYTLDKKGGKYSYPGKIPVDNNLLPQVWNKEAIKKFLSPVFQWLTENNVEPKSILVGEFGVRRDRKGAEMYLRDVMNVLDEAKMHWAFYSYREDNWDKVDYELGPGSMPPKGYYWRLEQGKPFPGKHAYKKNILFDEILKGLAR